MAMGQNWHARADAEFGGELRVFRLGLREIFAIEGQCGAGLARIYRLLDDGNYTMEHLRTVVRFGLEGAGMPVHEAGRLVQLYVRPPLVDVAPIAMMIIAAALYYPPELAEGNVAGGVGATATASPLPTSTDSPL